LKKLQGALRGRPCRVGRTFGISRNPADRSEFLQRSPTDAAMVPTRLNRPSLPSVHPAALPTAPGKWREGKDFPLQRMVDGDRQGAIPIHLGHLAEKIRPMIRPPLQDVVLPLMNHFVRQRAHDLLLAILAPLGGLMEQGKGQANLALGWRAKPVPIRSRPRSSTTHEHADRGGQPTAPDEIDRGQQACEVAAIQFAPHLGQMLRSYRRRLTSRHAKGVTPILRGPPRPTTAP